MKEHFRNWMMLEIEEGVNGKKESIKQISKLTVNDISLRCFKFFPGGGHC